MTKKEFHITHWKVNTKQIQIDITYRCSLACLNCDRSVRQAPSNEYIPLKKIEKFVDESIKLNWEWRKIDLMGGEPTLHPMFFDVLKIFEGYKKVNPKCAIEISTNGFGKKVNRALSKIPDWVKVVNSRKKTVVQTFESYNVAPIDMIKFKNDDFSKACIITAMCGLGLNRYGFYPCAAGAAVDRVFGLDIGIKRLSQISDSTLKSQLKLLCRYCGHYKNERFEDRITEEKMSRSWRKTYVSYKREKPKLSLY